MPCQQGREHADEVPPHCDHTANKGTHVSLAASKHLSQNSSKRGDININHSIDTQVHAKGD